MRLRQLHIRNFRKIEELAIDFPPGLTVLVGENNTGKTAVIDALRLMLFPGRDFDSLRPNEDDFRVDSDYAAIEVSCTFCDLSDEDEVHFQECLIDIGDGIFEARLNTRAEFNTKTRRANVKSWGGETEGGSLPSNLYDYIATVYLQPLRNPETGLRPSRHSQVARLIDCLTPEEQYEEFEEIAEDANDKIRKLRPVKRARGEMNRQMSDIAGEELTQETELVFSDPAFHRIIAELHPEIDGLPFPLNGLGYNNLVFTAATLGTLGRSSHFSYRSILIEEPEAHLHPHLQVLLLRHLASVAATEEGNQVQVIASSHSPILASQAPIDSVVSVHAWDDGVASLSVCSIDIEDPLKKKLQRFLDATRAELFFARRVLMVEGIAEALLLPVLARIAGGCLKESSVTVLNTSGINFDAFLPLFGPKRLSFPVVVLTDGDAEEIGGDISAATKKLKRQTRRIKNVLVEHSEITFEHEMARSDELMPLMIEAFTNLHPRLGSRFKDDVEELESLDDKADAFLVEFLRAKTSKGEFAQELASVLESRLDTVAELEERLAEEEEDSDEAEELKAELEEVQLLATSIPEYIWDAFVYLEVVHGEVE